MATISLQGLTDDRLNHCREPPLPGICAPLAEKPGEQVWVIAERLICEAFDSRPKHVAVNRGPVDPTEGRAGVVFDRELHQSGHFVARQPAGKAQGGVDACGHAGTVRYRPFSTQRSATYFAPSRSRNPRYAQ